MGYNDAPDADAGTFFAIYFVLTLTAQAALGVGLTISAMAPNMTQATVIAPCFSLPLLVFGGTIVNMQTVPGWLAWLQWLSPIRYGNEALAHSQFDNAHYKQITKLFPPTYVDIP